MENVPLTVRQSFDREDDSIRIIILDGYLNFETYEVAKINMNRLLENRLYRIVVDLSETKYISSSGWAVFLGVLGAVQANGGDIKLAAMTDGVKFIFDALELNNVLKNYDTVKEAVEAFKK